MQTLHLTRMCNVIQEYSPKQGIPDLFDIFLWVILILPSLISLIWQSLLFLVHLFLCSLVFSAPPISQSGLPLGSAPCWPLLFGCQNWRHQSSHFRSPIFTNLKYLKSWHVGHVDPSALQMTCFRPAIELSTCFNSSKQSSLSHAFRRGTCPSWSKIMFRTYCWNWHIKNVIFSLGGDAFLHRKNEHRTS